jgi:hypothetical protein
MHRKYVISVATVNYKIHADKMAKFGELFITEKIPICHLEAPHLEACTVCHKKKCAPHSVIIWL